MQLYAPVDLAQLQQDLPCLLEITEWTKNFLAKPHPELGRSGPVCPFMPRALQLDSIRLAVVHAQHLNQQQLEEIVKHYRDVFLELEPKQGDQAFYKAMMLVFPDLQEAESFELIDQVQQKLKPFFVEEGLMIGEFHRQNESPGLHNPNFRPLRSPVPMLAIRFMAESDLPFLDRLTDEPLLRIRYLEAYLNRLSMVIKDEKKLSHARQALALAQAQVQLEQTISQPIAKTRKCPFARLAAVFS